MSRTLITQEPDNTLPLSARADDTTCICCNARRALPHHPGLLYCAQCGHVWARLDLPPERFDELYNHSYFKGGEYADYEEEESALRINFRKRAEHLARMYPAGRNLWEVGCAYGFFLKEASRYFTASGCDIAADAVRAATEQHGVDARCLHYPAYRPDHKFDIICMWDVVEHLPDPHRYMEKAYDDLAPGGLLALSTGDIGSLCARLRGSRWRLIHPPTHVHYFTRRSMCTLLTRLGYTDITFHYHAFWRNMGTTWVKLFAQRPAASRLYQIFHRLGVLHFNFPLNLFDIMTVYARTPRHQG